ncbi:MAG: histidine kinase dimerization/phosphoacceptor domain -containing protein [Rhodomicrobium sp.]
MNRFRRSKRDARLQPTGPTEKRTPLIEKAPNGNDRAELTRQTLDLRIRQQELLAELGVFALQRTPFAELLNHAVRIAAEGLQAELCKILEYVPSQNCLLLRAGVGWEPDLIGVATVCADLASPSGYALRTGKPVISNHLENEERFRTPELLATHGVRRAMNVILQGDDAPYGVLEADSRSEGEFTENDIAFLQGAANILGMAIERQRYERSLQLALEQQQVLLKEINHRVMNSLQIVAAMLSLQASGEGDEALKDKLQEAGSRVTAIARAHERLYRSTDVTRIDLAVYLSDICADLNDLAPQCQITFEASGPTQVETDKAIRIALITTELVTNAIKYAYPLETKGQVWVRLMRSAAHAIQISIRDEGTGVAAADAIEKSKGFGLRMSLSLVEQIGANLKVERRSPGTEFLIDVPLNVVG